MKEFYIVSDTHYWHKNIIKFQPDSRPQVPIREHNEILIERHNSVVKPNDEYWHLGDFGFCNLKQTLELLDRLNGKINFIIGNHDKQMQHSDVRRELNWSGYYHELRGFTKSAIPMFHFPLCSWNRSHYGSIHFHGHEHGNGENVGRRFDVGADTNQCYPYHLPTLVEQVGKQESSFNTSHRGEGNV